MNKYLINQLDGLYENLLDYRSRLLHAKIDRQYGALDGDAIEDLDQIRHSMSYLEDRISELKDKIGLRVYCVQVSSHVEMTIKVLAKSEDDAIELACEIFDNGINKTLGSEYGACSDSQGEVLGHESTVDDEAEVEYPYED